MRNRSPYRKTRTSTCVFGVWAAILALLGAMLIRTVFAAGPPPLSPGAPFHSLYASTAYELPLKAFAAPTARAPSWGSPIVLSPITDALWMVNPDAGTVTVLDAHQLQKLTEVKVGREPWSLAVAPDGQRAYVVDRALGTLVVVDAHPFTVRAQVAVGPEPAAVALSPSGTTAYVSVSAAGEVVQVDTRTLKVTARLAVGPFPYAVAVSNDGDGQDADEFVYVTHFLAQPRPGSVEATDDGRQGSVSLIDSATYAVAKTIPLAPDAHGFPNLLAGIALQGSQAWVPHVRSAPALPNRLTTTVFAAVAVLDLTSGQEEPAAQLALNDQTVFGSPVNNPVAAVPSPDGKTLYVVLAGSNLVEVVDISHPTAPSLVKFLPTGANPRGIALSADGRRGYVMNYLSRSVTVLDLERLEQVAEVPVTRETLDPAILRGKILFNSAVAPRMAKGSWISCASCHPDGGTDSVTWMFPDGPRQTPALWNAGQTLPWHWSATMDEPQDVELTIQTVLHGLGLAPGADPPLLGTPNAGRSPDLDALAAFLTQGIRPPALPQPDQEPAAGRRLFVSQGCVACHGGPAWTSSALPGAPGTLDVDGNGRVDAALRVVGSANVLGVQGQDGFDPPSLLGVGLTAPYLHDGSMPSLEALLASGHPHPGGARLRPAEIRALVDFLRTIGPQTKPFPMK